MCGAHDSFHAIILFSGKMFADIDRATEYTFMVRQPCYIRSPTSIFNRIAKQSSVMKSWIASYHFRAFLCGCVGCMHVFCGTKATISTEHEKKYSNTPKLDIFDDEWILNTKNRQTTYPLERILKILILPPCIQQSMRSTIACISVCFSFCSSAFEGSNIYIFKIRFWSVIFLFVYLVYI